MNKRQRKKKWKRETPKEWQHCRECGNKLDWQENFHRNSGVCDEYCYMNLVGISMEDFL
jgi:acetyl-CoA carboxylase beta subunit